MQEQLTKKLFFDKYDHRLTMNVSHKTRHTEASKFPHPAVVDYLISELAPEKGVRVRYQPVYSYARPSSYTIYFSDKRVFETLQEKFGEHITELMKPSSATHAEALSKDRVIVREKLFHGKYRFCVRTERRHVPGTYQTTSKHMDDMIKWAEETFKHLEHKTDYYIFKGWTTSFYFTNPADVLMMKLTWSDDIQRTERLMLLTELEPDKTPTK